MSISEAIKNIIKPKDQNADLEAAQSENVVEEVAPEENQTSQQSPVTFPENAENNVEPTDEATEQQSTANDQSPVGENTPHAVTEENNTLNTTEEVPVTDSPALDKYNLEKLQELADSLNRIKGDVAMLVEQSEQQRKILASEHDKDEMIDNLHRELTSYRNNFKQEITMPMVKSLIRIYNRLSGLSASYKEKFASEENLPQMCQDFVFEVSNSADAILSSLEEFDIETIQPAQGEQFNPKRHRCVRTEPTSESAVANTISAVLKVGFENISTGRIIEYPEVVVLKDMPQ